MENEIRVEYCLTLGVIDAGLFFASCWFADLWASEGGNGVISMGTRSTGELFIFLLFGTSEVTGGSYL